MYLFKGNKHLSLAQQEIMAAQKALFPSQPLWIFVSFVLRSKRKDNEG
jgi:hypothetical protein